MGKWENTSCGKSMEPFIRKISYRQAQRLYDLFSERLSYTRTRSGPMRRKLSIEDKNRFMETIYKKIAHDKDVGSAMFDGLPSEYIDQFHEAKAQYEHLQEKLKSIGKTLSTEKWPQEEVIEIANNVGAQITGFAKYYDPYYKRDMASLVFINYIHDRKVLVPSLEAYTLGFKKNIDIQSITNKIAETLWARGIYCEPVSNATYYHLDNIEFNQVRFCEAALSGGIGKHFLFISPQFGPRFRMGQVILYPPPQMKFQKPKSINFCKDCTICIDACPSKALQIDDAIVCSRYFMSHDHCSICMDVCPVGKH